MKKKDIDLDVGWKILNLKMKDLKDKVSLMQINMNRLLGKYHISKPVNVYVKSDANRLENSEAKDEKESNVQLYIM